MWLRLNSSRAFRSGALGLAFGCAGACSRSATPARVEIASTPAASDAGATLAAAAVAVAPSVRGPKLAANSATANASNPAAAPSAAPVQLDRDGDDDITPEVDSTPPQSGHFVRVGRAPLALKRICDLTAFGDALYAAHATEPLGQDGASISRYRPSEAQPFSVAFDWNRAGEPSKGGGAGQGFLRVHAFAGRLFVPDADPPYNGFGISEPGTEGFVFVSSGKGEFARARMPGHRPPPPPDPSDRPGALVLPRAYHVLDTALFRGKLYASTGSVPPGQRAWRGPSPGALHVVNADWSRLEYAVDYPHPWQDGVWRLTYLVRFRDRLYVGIQDYDGREPNDYLVVAPPPEQGSITQADLRAVRVTERGGAQTLRWYADRGKLYWIAWSRAGVGLRVTADGETWKLIELPREAGVPTDIVRFRGALFVLTERALLRLDGEVSTVVARVVEKKSPFELTDGLCAAPLAVFSGVLYAGGQQGGTLYRFETDGV